ncbi:MAG TPA: PA2169 family four-helix-bundle protein [Bacteroidales bacterium]|nr:PA2169 family four-helix-bundle protein [Bacteroidales bacterium]
MAIIDKQTRILNDLILINNDRVTNYRKAEEELKKEDADLIQLFQEKVEQSNNFIDELTQKVTEAGHKVESGTTNAGKIYHVWMDVKAFFGGFNRKIILDNCVVGEDAALSAYNDALSSEGLSPEIRSLLTQHHADLIVSYNKVKALKEG